VPFSSLLAAAGVASQIGTLRHSGRFDVPLNSAAFLDPDSYEVNRSAAYLRYRQNRPGDAALYFEKAMTLLDT
jgi:hypothetical protein